MDSSLTSGVQREQAQKPTLVTELKTEVVNNSSDKHLHLKLAATLSHSLVAFVIERCQTA